MFNAKLKAVTFSYDDGVTQDRRLIEIFNKYGIKATFHINGNKLQNLSDEELKERGKIYEGHEVSCHAFHHSHLSPMPAQIVAKELVDDRILLEKMCGYPVRGMSYPFGKYNDEVINCMKAAGMEYSRTGRCTNGFPLPANWLAWDPTCHHKADLKGLWKTMEARLQWLDMPVMYIYGHSFELDLEPDNWVKLDALFATLSNREDIFYGTNKEVLL